MESNKSLKFSPNVFPLKSSQREERRLLLFVCLVLGTNFLLGCRLALASQPNPEVRNAADLINPQNDCTPPLKMLSLNKMPWIIYKSKSALQIEIDSARQTVFLSFARAKEGSKGLPQKGERRYEWENKIVFALSPEEAFDIALQAKDILEGSKEPVEIYHRPPSDSKGEADKILALRPGEGKSSFLSLAQGENKITLALNRGDLFRLATALPIMVAPLLFSGKE